jgi:putative sigma-54 modulation protein
MKNDEISINVTFRHLDATDAIKDHATKKVAGVLAQIPGGIDAHIILASEPHHHRASCEIVVHATHTKLTAHDEGQDLYAAIDNASTKLAGQARRHKGRVVNESRRAGASRKAG